MSKLNGKIAKVVRLHAPTHITGVGNLTSPVDSNNHAVRSGLIILTYEDGNVLVTNTKTKGVTVIPSGNLQSVELETEKNS